MRRAAAHFAPQPVLGKGGLNYEIVRLQNTLPLVFVGVLSTIWWQWPTPQEHPPAQPPQGQVATIPSLPKRYAVSSGVIAGNADKRVRPDNPEKARKKRMQDSIPVRNHQTN